MTINARVKNTGELFEATNEEQSSSDVHVLEEGKSYTGFLYSGYFAKGDLSVFTCTTERTQATFSANELEQIPIPKLERITGLSFPFSPWFS